MTPAEFADRMKRVSDECDDTEIAHSIGDGLMLEILREAGYGEGCDIFEAMDKWYA